MDVAREGGGSVGPVLHAPPLRLDPLGPHDAPHLHALWTVPGVRRFLWDDEIIPAERTREVIETSVRMFREHGFGLWAAREAAGGRLVGFAGFWYFREPPALELLYGIAEDAWGRGLATAAARAVVSHGHDVLGMPVIRASTDAGNAASLRVLARLGFEQAGRATVDGLDTVFFEHRSAHHRTRTR